MIGDSKEFDPQAIIEAARAAYTTRYDPIEILIKAIEEGDDQKAACVIDYSENREAVWEGYLKHHKEQFDKKLQQYIDNPGSIVDTRSISSTINRMFHNDLNPIHKIGPTTLATLATHDMLKNHMQKDEEKSSRYSFKK